MSRNYACAVLLFLFAIAGAPELRADMPAQGQAAPLIDDECNGANGFLCFGPERDFLVDRLYRYNCNDAQRILKHRNFTDVKATSCGGRWHYFSARWKGKTYRIKMSSATGEIVTMKRTK